MEGPGFLSSSTLSNLWLKECNVSDCIFDNCDMSEVRLWGTSLSNVSFRSANLRGALLGGVSDSGKRNLFRNVDFSRADLRGTIYSEAEFVGCQFNNTKLDKVDFQSSTFEDCVFEGELREVLFYRRGFRKGNFPENKMTRVDLSRARLRWTEFRGLDLADISPPSDDDHIALHNFPTVVGRLIEHLDAKSDLSSRRLNAVFKNKKKWLGSDDSIGILSKSDIIEAGGQEGLQSVLQIIEESGNRTRT